MSEKKAVGSPSPSTSSNLLKIYDELRGILVQYSAFSGITDLRCEFEFLCLSSFVPMPTVVDDCETFWTVVAAHKSRDFHYQVCF